MLDPDLGWHLRMGETIVKTGIPLTDPFSYTMPSFPAVGNEWLNNVMEYLIYREWGKTGLAVIWAGMAAAAVALVVPGRLRKWATVPILLASGTLVGLGGVRAQVIDWLMLALTLRLWEKKRWVLPMLFGLWANLHGAFGLGPMVLGILIGVKIWQERKVDWRDVGVWAAGVAATLVNPWGGGLWREVWSQLSDGGIKWTIAEWQPFWLTAPWIGVAMLAAGGGVLWWKFGRREKVERVAMAAALGAMAFGGVRHTALFALAAIPVMTEGLLGLGLMGERVNRERWKMFYKLLIMAAVLVAGVESGVGLWFSWHLREEKFYPQKAVEWIGENGVVGRLFTEYGWGGYMGWKIPEEKVFIDGRMATWKGEEKVFDKYLAITSGKEDYCPVFEKYGVGMVVWSKRDVRDRKKEKFKLPQALEEKGWLKVYEDGTSLVYKKI